MRRALLASAGTVVGLVALLGYKSAGSVNLQKVALGTTTPSPGSPSPGSRSPGSAGPGSTGTAPPTTATTPTTGPPSSTGKPSAPAAGTTAPSTTTAPSPTGTYTGQDVQYNYGDIQLAVNLKAGKIASISVVRNGAIDGRSQMINSYAVPVLEQEAVAAQGLNFYAVSGATFTSDAFAQSLQSALQQAGK